MYLNNLVLRANKYIFQYPEALNYLEGRGITQEDILRYSLGFTKYVSLPDDGSEDFQFLAKKTAGFQMLQGKLIIPCKNLLGHVNGLVVRDIYKKEYRQYFLDEAKKLGTFFGLYEAFPEILRTRKVFIHEAALDSISFAKAFPNSVSVLTSFMNEVQYETLTMLADKIIMVFDEDSAGNIGRDQVYDLYGRKHLSDISIGYNDSNAILKRLGPESFKKYVWNRVPILLRE